jgi:hypothetical protein
LARSLKFSRWHRVLAMRSQQELTTSLHAVTDGGGEADMRHSVSACSARGPFGMIVKTVQDNESAAHEHLYRRHDSLGMFAHLYSIGSADAFC